MSAIIKLSAFGKAVHSKKKKSEIRADVSHHAGHVYVRQTIINPQAGESQEFQRWLLWSGRLPQSYLPVSRSGLYTDFN